MTNKFELGWKLKDIVSGFTGIATARLEYLNGCVRYHLVGPVQKDGEIAELYVDVQQLKKVSVGIIAKKKVAKTGGPKGLKLEKYGS